MVLGTDYPFEMGDLDPLATLRATPGLGPNEYEMITDGNLRRIVDSIRR